MVIGAVVATRIHEEIRFGVSVPVLSPPVSVLFVGGFVPRQAVHQCRHGGAGGMPGAGGATLSAGGGAAAGGRACSGTPGAGC
jgi:hypothetical protein